MGEETAFYGVIDLLVGQATIFPNGRDHPTEVASPEPVPVPPEYQTTFQQYRQTMIEKIVETDEDLLIRYLEGEDLGEGVLRQALRRATIEGHLVPVLCGSAISGKGIPPLLDAIICYLPSPEDVPPMEGIDPKTQETVLRFPDEESPLAALAFKVVTDPFSGRLVFLRVYSGRIKAGASVINVTKGHRERMGRLLQMHANRREDLEEVFGGNICAAVGLKNTFTGDTIGTEYRPVILEPPKFPQPVVSVAIEPITRGDQDKLSDALHKLSDEDPTFLVRFNSETGQTIISGMGELHLEVLVDRMRREFNVAAHVGSPRVAYREAITRPVRAEGRFVRQTGGHGQYGHVWLELEPLERGAGIIFESALRGAVIPREYISDVEAGARQALENGPLSGYSLVDIKVTLVDGSYHSVDSSDLAFRQAAILAIHEGVRKGRPVLLEPILGLEVVTPGEFLSEVLGDLGTRRAQIRNIEGQGDIQVVKAMIPLGETFAYTTDLRSITRGRATFSTEFRHYEPVPENLLKTIVNIA